MTILEHFNECVKGHYNNTENYLSWKIINRVLYLQCSKEKEDWKRNFDLRPAKLKNGLIIVPKGFSDSVEEMLDINAEYDAVVGYSHGAAVAAILSGLLDMPAIAFGCPRFIFRPSKKARRYFDKLHIYNNGNDIFTFITPFYSHCGNINILKDIAVKTGSFMEWYSGHSPNRYRQNLKGL